MKLNKITAFFCIGMPICVVLRIFQVAFTVELETGFYMAEYQTIGKLISVAIALFCVILGFFCFKYYKSPEKPPKQNIVLSIASVVLAVITAAQAFFDIGVLVTAPWQILIIKVLGIITAAYFIYFAISKYINIKIPHILHIIPCVFIVFRTAFVFIYTSALAHITDNVFLLATNCVVMVFFLNFAKLYNGIDSDKNFKKLLSSGSVGASLCFIQSISHIVINILSGNKYLHVSHISNIHILLMGIFILIFLISHFVLNKND